MKYDFTNALLYFSLSPRRREGRGEGCERRAALNLQRVNVREKTQKEL
jgi:hypothetical protein